MRVLLGFPPFHPPTSPPYGLACLRSALNAARPGDAVRVVDWDLALFQRWLGGDPPHLCDLHPDALQGLPCPTALARERGPGVSATLRRLPRDEAQAADYMQAARAFDAIHGAVYGLLGAILLPYVEQRSELDDQDLDRLFGDELALIEQWKPDLLGLSILAERNLVPALALCRAARAHGFRGQLVLGGAMTSHLESDELLHACPELDFVLQGEAEQTLPALLAALEGEGELEDVRGLAHRRQDRSVCIHRRPLPFPLNALPDADFSDFSIGDYLAPEPVLPISTCRGCYWGKCSFCSHTRPHGETVRARSPERIVAELAAQHERHGVRAFLFVDEAIAPRMLDAISQQLLERGLDLRWGAEGVRLERHFDAALLTRARKAGLRWVYVGVESSQQRLLDLMDKGIDAETIRSFVQCCQDIGIVAQLSFIVGLPTTTEAELQAELAFMRDFPTDHSTFVTLLGSPMHQDPERYGLRIESRSVLLRCRDGALVHAPRFTHTTSRGLSTPLADALVDEVDETLRRRRPHLGEVHATLLADTTFFQSEDRPPSDPPAALQVLQILERQQQRDGWWVIHGAACLEALGELEQAAALVQQALDEALEPGERERLLVHLSALANRLGSPEVALQIGGAETTQRWPALRAEVVRALHLLGRHDDVLTQAGLLLDEGYAPDWLAPIRAEALEATGGYADAITAYGEAESAYPLVAELDLAIARCLRALGETEEAQRYTKRALRKAQQTGDEASAR